jgi:folate-binding protein YgfZ
MTASLAQLSSRALIGLEGPDWRSFLQGLISQDVETLAAGEMRYGALLSPQGRLIDDLFIVGGTDGALLDVAAEARDGLIDRLTIYRLRAKVEIAAVKDQVFAAWSDAPPGEGWRADPRLASMGWRRVGASVEGAGLERAYHERRLALGVPDPATNAAESDYPIELNFDLLNGLDFKKGCFVGQETTSRMHRRGVVKTRMAPVSFYGPPPPFGAEILAGDLRAGEIRGGCDGRALALLRIDRSRGPLTADGRPLTLELPAWLARWFDSAADETPQSYGVLSS